MSNPRLKVVLTRRLPDAVETRMRELFDAELNLKDRPMDRAALEAAVKRAEVLVPTITDEIDASLIEGAGAQLKMIANFGAGVDHIDIDAAVARGIIVTNTPGVLTEDTADLAMSLILAVSRRIVEGAQVIADGKFEGWAPTWMCGRKLWGKRLGIVGMGRIGQALARRAKAFGLQVHYHNRKAVSPRIEEELGATYWDDLDQMLARMDIISLNCPATKETHHLLSAERLALLQPHAILVNTARGELIDEAALAAAVAQRAVSGVGLDVFEHEPVIHPGLIGLPHVVLLPHLGSATLEARQDMGDRVILNVMTYQNGHRPPDRVIPAMFQA
ncbi:MAG: D-glycerate dehydrogenase [Brevundimonas sp.]|uniref:2-hydroxyacid dehydrogenase n=1 Tax=Brevundimonas sp. TaxID=1871086 RepID=UPI002735875A|nr:D-glycerate dehydrogenase [Brevundimonas sp.]MDP3403569.1 D-glycerate dehydrogenase [Brevundimonas sp.]